MNIRRSHLMALTGGFAVGLAVVTYVVFAGGEEPQVQAPTPTPATTITPVINEEWSTTPVSEEGYEVVTLDDEGIAYVDYEEGATYVDEDTGEELVPYVAPDGQVIVIPPDEEPPPGFTPLPTPTPTPKETLTFVGGGVASNSFFNYLYLCKSDDAGLIVVVTNDWQRWGFWGQRVTVTYNEPDYGDFIVSLSLTFHDDGYPCYQTPSPSPTPIEPTPTPVEPTPQPTSTPSPSPSPTPSPTPTPFPWLGCSDIIGQSPATVQRACENGGGTWQAASERTGGTCSNAEREHLFFFDLAPGSGDAPSGRLDAWSSSEPVGGENACVSVTCDGGASRSKELVVGLTASETEHLLDWHNQTDFPYECVDFTQFVIRVYFVSSPSNPNSVYVDFMAVQL